MFKIPRATRKRLNFRKPTTDASVLGGLSKFRAFRPDSVLQTRYPFLSLFTIGKAVARIQFRGYGALVPFYLFILIILVALVNNVKFKNTFKFCKLALKFFLSFPSIFLNKLHYSFHGNYYHGEGY